MRPGFPLIASVMLLPISAFAESERLDFSDGLEKLADLGLPDMTGAEWVKRPSSLKEDPRQSFRSSYEFGKLKTNFPARVWRLPGDAPRYLEFAGSSELESSSKEDESEETEEDTNKELSILEKMMRNHAAQQPKKEKKPKPGPSLEKDVSLIVEALSNTTVMDNIIDDLDYSSPEALGRCLVFAAQLQAAGKIDEANRVAAALFAALPDDTVAIDAAVSYFADTQYQKSADEFFGDNDWVKYHQSVLALLEKYPRGWTDSLAVAMLTPHLEKRAEGNLPPEPSIPDIDLVPAATKALADLLEPQGSDGVSDEELVRSYGFEIDKIPEANRAQILASLRSRGLNVNAGNPSIWILDPPPAAKAVTPSAQLRALGMDGLIALAAVATDETLIPVRNVESSGRYYSRNDSAEEAALRSYKSMNRPQSRGEFAREMLKSCVPTQEDRDEIDPELLRESAIEFWRNHRTDTAIELAEVFLSEGDDTQQSLAASFLARSDLDGASEAFEQAVLNSDDPSAFSSSVEAYLDQKKVAAKPFFSAFSKKLTESLDGVDIDDMRYSSGSYPVRQAGSVEKYLKKLSVKVGAVSLEEIVKDAMEAEVSEDGSSPISDLHVTLSPVPLEECLSVIGKAISRATEEQSMELHMLLLNLSFRQLEEESDDSEAQAIPSELLDVWQPLLEKSEQLPEKTEFSSWAKAYGAKTAGDASAIVLEVATTARSGQMFNAYGNITGDLTDVAPFVRKRIAAKLASKPPEAWPSADRVSDLRKAEIETKLTRLPAMDITPFAKALSLDERMALTEIVLSYHDDKPAPPGLLELRDTVVGVRPYNIQMPHDPALAEELGIQIGYKVTLDGLTELTKSLTLSARKNSGTTVRFYQAPMQLGYLASASRTTDFNSEESDNSSLITLARWFDHYENPDALAMIASSASGSFWELQDGKAVALEAHRSAINEIKSTLDSKAIRNLYLHIEVLTREDAKKIYNEE